MIRLCSWKFDDEVGTDPNEWNWIEVSLTMSDESKRWCILYTPARLSNNLKRSNINPPGLHIKHMIIVRSYNFEDVDRVLRYLDSEGELLEASLPL